MSEFEGGITKTPGLRSFVSDYPMAATGKILKFVLRGLVKKKELKPETK